jgi:hypothetical protein
VAADPAGEVNTMIPKSEFYKLVRKVDGLILAAGNKREILNQMNITRGTLIYITDRKVGEYVKRPSNETLQ